MASPPSYPSSSSKKTKGRQKVKMARMEKDSNRQVTFSKRRCGLFKKANELSTLCGAEVAVVVFSPGGKPFSFGHPSVETILRRFITSNSSSSSVVGRETVVEFAQQSATVRNLNINLNDVNCQIEIARTKNAEINEIKKAKEQLYLWDRAVDELSFQQLVHLKTALEGLKKNVVKLGKRIFMLEASNDANHNQMMGINYPMLACFNGAKFDLNNDPDASCQNYY